MPRETFLTALLARIASIPFGMMPKRPIVQPVKALILKPCCISQVMLATPMLAGLKLAYPQTFFDWAISDWARPAIAGNPHITQLISAGPGSINQYGWMEVREIVSRLRLENYDTCFIPSRSSLLSLIAFWARIPQRIGLHVSGRGFAHTISVKPPERLLHESAVYLSILNELGDDLKININLGMEFYPADIDRTAITQKLVDQLDWLGDSPLVVIHPGGGTNPLRSNLQIRWPVERFVLLGNHLVRKHNAKVLLVGGVEDKSIGDEISGLMSAPVANWVGKVSLAEVGALSEVANIYIGNDAGPTLIAAAVGCPTIAIFGPSNPKISGPFVTKGKVKVLWHERTQKRPFSWEDGVTVVEVIKAADELLEKNKSF